MNIKLSDIASISIERPQNPNFEGQNKVKELSQKEIEIIINSIKDSYKITKKFNPEYIIHISLVNGDKKRFKVLHDEITENEELFEKLRNEDIIRDLYHESPITTDKEIQLLKLKQNNPAKNWLTGYLDGYGIFTKYIIIESEYIFDTYFYELLKLEDSDEDKILDCVQKAMDAFNKINFKYENFIHTDEREEIMDFLKKGAIIVGLNREIDFDKIKRLTRNW